VQDKVEFVTWVALCKRVRRPQDAAMWLAITNKDHATGVEVDVGFELWKSITRIIAHSHVPCITIRYKTDGRAVVTVHLVQEQSGNAAHTHCLLAVLLVLRHDEGTVSLLAPLGDSCTEGHPIQ
jgi:hypothetical protein